MRLKRLVMILALGLGGTLLALAVISIGVTEVRADTRTVCPPPGGSGCDDTSIQNAVGAANSGDTIILTAGTYTEHVTIPKSLTLQGAGVEETIIHGGQNNNVLYITGDKVNVTLTGMTIRDGKSTGSGAGIEIDTDGGTHVISDCIITNNNAGSDGAGMFFSGANNQLTIINSIIRNNNAQSHGGGILLESSSSTLQIINSAILSNTAVGFGGGIAFMDTSNTSVLTITNSTISGNQAQNGGGGLNPTPNSGTTYLNNITIAYNTADSNNDGTGVGGGILTGGGGGGRTYIANTLIANNLNSSNNTPDCASSGVISSTGYNLIGDGSNCGWPAGVGGDQIGPGGGVTPGVSLLYGLPPYHLLLASSTAISGGNPAASGSGFPACAATDQGGRTRPLDGRCDIGAYEYDSSLVIKFTYLPIVVKS